MLGALVMTYIGGATPTFLGGPILRRTTTQHWGLGTNRNHCV